MFTYSFDINWVIVFLLVLVVLLAVYMIRKIRSISIRLDKHMYTSNMIKDTVKDVPRKNKYPLETYTYNNDQDIQCPLPSIPFASSVDDDESCLDDVIESELDSLKENNRYNEND